MDSNNQPPESAPTELAATTTEEGPFGNVYQKQQGQVSSLSNIEDRAVSERENPFEQPQNIAAQIAAEVKEPSTPVSSTASVNNDPLLGHLPPVSSNLNETTLEDIDAAVIKNSAIMHGEDDDEEHLEEGDPSRLKFQNEYNIEEDYEDPDYYVDDDEVEAFEDPYADSPFPDRDPSSSPYHSNMRHRHSTNHSNEGIPADGVGTSIRMNAVDPFGELEYNPTAITREEEMEEIEMSHNDSMNLQGGDYTAEYELESKDAKTQGWQARLQQHGKALGLVASGLCFSGTLVAIILVATVRSQEKNPWSTSTPHYEGAEGSHSMSPWGPRRESVPAGPFVPPPLALETLCTREAVSASQEGFNACVDLCEPAQCCRFDALAAPQLSCQRGHTQDCHTYHHYCSNPPKGAIVEFKAPSDSIADTCTPENLRTAAGVTACARECMGGTCCRYPTTLAGLSCLRGHEQECQVYHTFCESKEDECETDHTFCQPTNGNGGNETAASTATASPGTGTNTEGGQQPTGIFSFPFVKPPATINVTCAQSAVVTAEGFEACLEVCEGGTCCRFDADRQSQLSCRNDQPSDCAIYDQFCGGNSHTVNTEAPVNPAYGSGISGNSGNSGTNNNANEIPTTYVESVCSDASLATVEGYGNCEIACGKAECCWDSAAGACPIGAHCAPFAHCLALKNSEYEDVAIRVHIDARCTDEKVATTEGKANCRTACSQAACCFDSGAQCPQKSDSFCDLYSACTKIMDETSVPPAPASLQSHCDASSLGTIEGLANCDRTCAHALCCWKSNVESCVATNALCEDYEACLILNRDSESQVSPTQAPTPAVPSIPNAPNFLADVCTEQKIVNVEGATLCHDACKAGECCWKNITCAEQTRCEGYKNCAVLLDSAHLSADAPSVSQIPDYMNTSCATEMHSADEVHGHLCADACNRASCCWDTKSETVCRSDPHCTGYEICATKDLDKITTTVAPQADSSTGNEQPVTDTSGVGDPKYTEEMITDVCTNHDNSIVNLCAKICVGSECCFEDPSTCDDGLCEKYAACSVLHPNDSAVEAACSSGDRSDCLAACGGSTCCFTTDIEKSCANTNPGIVCSQYKPCEKLYGFGG